MKNSFRNLSVATLLLAFQLLFKLFKLLPYCYGVTFYAKISYLSHSTNCHPIKIMLRELLTPNIQRIKSICTIGAMHQQVLFGFGIFLCGLVFAEDVSSAFHTCRLNGKNKIIVVLTVEVRHQALLA